VHRPARELTDLHIHVGAAVAPHILWAREASFLEAEQGEI
jgi:hypothetical protein